MKKLKTFILLLISTYGFAQNPICSYCDSLYKSVQASGNESLQLQYNSSSLKYDTSYYFNGTRVTSINESNNARITFLDHCGKEKERRVIATPDLLLALHNMKMESKRVKLTFQCGYWCILDYFKKYQEEHPTVLDGYVIISVHVDEHGKVYRTPEVESSNPIMSDYIVEAIQRMPAWTPASYDGKPHASFERFAFVFGEKQLYKER